MLQIVQDTRIPFMRYRKWAYLFSVAIMVAGVASVLLHGGFRLGIDFTGGRFIEYELNQRVPADLVRSVVTDLGLQGAEIQSALDEGRHFLIVRLPVREERLADEDSPSALILEGLKAKVSGLDGELRKEELVGPKVGRELRGKAFVAVLISLLGILIYVGWRYEFTYALGGVAALAHDVLVTLFMFSVFDKEITIPIIAALLTIGGYSINDTVVVFDRIREQAKMLQRRNLKEVIDIGINSTLSRTLITSATTLYAVAALFFLGGEVIHDFAFAMLIGVAFGTYSSVYVASALALELGQKRNERRARRERAA